MVLAVALAVRLWGIGWQLPAALYFDEMKYVERAGATVRGQPRETVDFRNPTLFRHLLEVEWWSGARSDFKYRGLERGFHYSIKSRSRIVPIMN